MDETPCPIIEAQPSGWSYGNQEKLEVRVDANPKDVITVVPTITAGGDLLKMAWINRSKTIRPLAKLDNIPSKVHGFFSESGWMTSDIMLQYLREIILPYTKKRKCALIVDTYEAHFTPEVKALAKKLHVELVAVPEGTTSVCQPLDVNFNGPFKRARERLWLEERSGGRQHTDNVERTVMRASRAHDSMTAQTVSQAWAGSFPADTGRIMHRYRPRHDGV